MCIALCNVNKVHANTSDNLTNFDPISLPYPLDLAGGSGSSAAAAIVGRGQEQNGATAVAAAAAMCRQDQDRMALIAFADGVQVSLSSRPSINDVPNLWDFLTINSFPLSPCCCFFMGQPPPRCVRHMWPAGPTLDQNVGYRASLNFKG